MPNEVNASVPREVAFRCSVIATVIFAASNAVSREAALPAAGDVTLTIEEIVVTGSRIKRRDFTSVSPIATIDADEITRGGITNLEDLVGDLPQLVPNLDRTGNNPFNGAAQLDLRGLGPGRTLVMLNGRRAAPHDVFGAVNINNIPSAFVERVEVVTGGASTVYGSDAVSGVVNFILDTEFSGVQLSTQYDVFGDGDGGVLDANLSLGSDVNGVRGHIMGFLNFQDREAVWAGDREFTRVSLSENFATPTGEIVPGGSPSVPGGAIFFPPTDLPGIGVTNAIIFHPDGTARPFVNPDDLYNFQPANYLQVPHRRNMGGLFGNYAVMSGVVLFGELIWSASETAQQLAPSPIRDFLVTNVDHPSLTPEQQSLAANNWDADGDGLANFFIQRRLSEVGPRIGVVDSDSLRAVAGFDGEFAFGWDWEVSYSFSETDKEYELINGAFASRLQQGLLADPNAGECHDPSGGCVPISLFGDGSLSPEGVLFLRAVDIADSETVKEQIVSLNATGDLLQAPAGTVAVAAGVEWRELSSELVSDPNLIGGGVLGYLPQSGVDGAFNVKEIYVEALVPLISQARLSHYLGIEAGLRYSYYSLSGASLNWKFGVDWAPLEVLRFRAMHQRATRAPNINELFRIPIEGVEADLGQFADECSASRDPVANGVADLCIAQGIPADQIGVFEAADFFPATVFLEGGNTNLDPEEAETYTVGIVVQPATAPDLSLAIDYYDIEIGNSIGAVSSIAAIALCFDSNDINSNFCRSIVRAPSGDIVELTNPQFNLAQSKARGVDVIIDYQRELPQNMSFIGGEASMAIRFFGSHMIESGRQETPGSPFIDCAGYFGGLCVNSTGNFVMPENRTSTRFIYYSGPVSVSLSWEWIDELYNHIDILNAVIGTSFRSELDKAGARNYVDLSMRFDIGDSIEVYGGVSNVFEESPPLLGFGATQSNTAPQLYDVFGRRFFLGFSYRRM